MNRLRIGAALGLVFAAFPDLLQAQTDYAALDKEYKTALEAFTAKVNELRAGGKSREELAAYSRENNPAKDFVERFRAGAKEKAGQEEAIPYLTWLGTNGTRVDPKISTEAWTTLLTDHPTSNQIAPAVVSVGRMAQQIGGEKARELLTAVVEKSPQESIRIQARFARAGVVLGDREASDEARATAVEDLKAVIASKETALAKRAEGQLFVLENLQIGMTAPDIVANDLDGVEFKLSDYRGKVVVLDFWGDW